MLPNTVVGNAPIQVCSRVVMDVVPIHTVEKAVGGDRCVVGEVGALIGDNGGVARDFFPTLADRIWSWGMIRWCW